VGESNGTRDLGYTDFDLIGVGVEELVPERLRGSHFTHRQAYNDNSRVRPMGLGLDLTGRKKDGAEFPVEISLSPLQTKRGLLVTAIVRDVTERRLLEEERNLLAIQLQTEQERDRIAMDLHDGIMQDIYAAALTLELALDDSDDKRYAESAGVERAIDQMHDIVRNVRSYVFDLRPRGFTGSLAEALGNLSQEFQQNSQIRTEVGIEAEPQLDQATAMAIYHIAHEALSNIRKHAGASCAYITLRFKNGSGELEVRDDGVGFDTSVEVPERHRGLRNIIARARAIGGNAEVESAVGVGTILRANFPVR
jgi:PAS domain S-box-containing protein